MKDQESGAQFGSCVFLVLGVPSRRSCFLVLTGTSRYIMFPNPKPLRTHILRLLGLKTILYKAFVLLWALGKGSKVPIWQNVGVLYWELLL